MTLRRRAVVRGRVQGVNFRYSTVRRAEQLGLSGWVRNRHDGTVEIEAQGTEMAVEQLLAWAREGPRGARVEAVDLDDLEPVEGERGFDVRY